MAIPKEGYFELEKGRYGAIFPKTPANYGFTIIAKIKPGREDVIRAYGKKIEGAIAGDPFVLAPLKLHYLRWVLFNIGSDTYFMYQGIFDTDFDKYTEDAITLFKQTGVDTVFENLEGFPMDWKTNAPAFVKFVREHQCPSFLEYGEYPFVTATDTQRFSRLTVSATGLIHSERPQSVPRERLGRWYLLSYGLEPRSALSGLLKRKKFISTRLPRLFARTRRGYMAYRRLQQHVGAAVARQNFRLRQFRCRTVFIGIAKDEFAGFDRRPRARCRTNSSSFNFRGREPVAIAKMFTYISERYRF